MSKSQIIEMIEAEWRDRLKAAVLAERKACAEVVDHILKEGGGTWGDAIRARDKHD